MVKVSRRSARIFRARGMTTAYRQGYKAAQLKCAKNAQAIYRKGYQAGYHEGWHDNAYYQVSKKRHPRFLPNYESSPWDR